MNSDNGKNYQTKKIKGENEGKIIKKKNKIILIIMKKETKVVSF